MSEDNKPTAQEQVASLVGYGQVIRLLAGRGEDGQPKYIDFHFTPSPMSKIPALSEKLDAYMSLASSTATTLSLESIKAGAEVVKIALERMHPDITLEQIMELFPMGAMGKAINIIMDLNDFFSEMRAITANLQQGVAKR